MAFGNYPLVDGGTLGLNNYAVIAVTPTIKGDGEIASAVWLSGAFPNPYRVDLAPAALVAALEADGRLFTSLDEYGGAEIFIATDTPFASAAVQTWAAPEGGHWCAVYLDDLAPFIVAGERGDVEAALLPGKPAGGSSTSRNTFDGYSSTLTNERSLITVDDDRVITAEELVSGTAIIWSPSGGGTVQRVWTMPDLATMDAAIIALGAGRELTDPGSGGRSLVIYNRSAVPLVILDSGDFRSLTLLSGYTIPPFESAVLTWGCPSTETVNNELDGPGVPIWWLTVSAAQPRAGQIWAGGLVNPGTGECIAAYSFGGAVSAGPYTPLSGSYAFNFNTVPVGWNYLVLTSTDNAGLCTVAGNEGGPSTCTVIGSQDPSWNDTIPFKWCVVLVPPPPGA